MVRTHDVNQPNVVDDVDAEEVYTEEECIVLPEYKDQVRTHANSGSGHSSSSLTRNIDPPAIQSSEFLHSNSNNNKNHMKRSAAVTAVEAPSQNSTASILPLAQAIPMARYVGSAPTSTDNNHHHLIDSSVVSPVLTTATKRTSTNTKSDDPKDTHRNPNDDFVLKISRTTCLWSMVVALLLGAVIGGFCGAGKCGGSNTTKSSNNSNSQNSNSTVPTAAPPPSSSNNNNNITISTTELYLRNVSLLTPYSERIFMDAEDLAIAWMQEQLQQQDQPQDAINFTDPMVQLRLQQQFVLANMYYVSTNQDAWKNTTNWLSHSTDVCQWHGIVCSPLSSITTTIDDNPSGRRRRHMKDTPDDNSNGNDDDTMLVITSILLADNNIRGPLTPNIGLLQYLAYLDVSYNMITGTLPSTLSNCRQMVEFKINDNLLTGSLPDELGTTWNRLEHFVAYTNPLMYGPIPDTYGGWTNVHTVDISGMGITGTLPGAVMSQWTNMYDFYASWNKLTGTLPDSIFTWTGIEYFSIEANQLNGTIPASIGLWTNIRELRLKENQLTGTIPSTINSWMQIQTINLETNLFTGSVPTAVCNVSTLMTFTIDIPCSCCTNETSSTMTDEPTPSPPFVMDVENYIISVAPNGGNISSPTMDAEVQAIDWLVQNNEILQLNVYDPVGQFRFRQRYALLTLYFGTSNDTDPWYNTDQQWLMEPDECLWYGITCTVVEPEAGLGNQSVVGEIDLTGNGLHGKLSPDLSLLTKLSHLFLSHNDISGSLPSELGNCGCFTEIQIANNSLTGTLPNEYGYSWLNLYGFEAWNNQFVGTIPESYGNWSNLAQFDMDANQLSGKIPSTICNWKNMEYFYMAENDLTGTIPDNFGNSTPNMKHFGINDNRLSGTISPTYGTSWTTLELFNIGNNPFIGTIPATISKWSTIATINLVGTNVTGTIPDAICNVATLSYLGADSSTVSCDCCDCCGY